MTVYAYQDVDRNTVMLNDTALNFTGTWSSSGTYEAATKDVVDYASSQFVAIVDNTGVVPTQAPRRNQTARWSSLVVIRSGTDSTGHTADEAYTLAFSALSEAEAAQAAGLVIEQTGSEHAFDLWTAGTRYTDAQIATVSPSAGSEYAFDLFLAGTNYTDSRVTVEAAARIAGDSAVQQHGSEFAYDLYLAGTAYTDGQSTVETTARISGDQAEATARVFGDGTTLAQAKAYADSLPSGASGSNYAFSLFVQGTNYTDSRITVEAAARGAADAVVAQQGSNFSYELYKAGTNYANNLTPDSSAGSNYAFHLFVQGTNFTTSQVAVEAGVRSAQDSVVAQQGSNYAFELYKTGTNYTSGLSTDTNVRVSNVENDIGIASAAIVVLNNNVNGVIFQTGTLSSQVAVLTNTTQSLFSQGTNFTTSQVAIEIVSRTAADQSEAASRVFADGTVAQQGSNYAFELYKTGTNYTNSVVVGTAGSQVALNYFYQGTTFTNSQVAVEVLARVGADQTEAAARVFGDGTTGQQGSNYALNLFTQGTNYASAQVAIEVVSRVAADQAEASARVFGGGTIAQQGSNFAYELYKTGTNYTNSAIVVAAGSQFALNLFYQGTNFTNSQVAVEVLARVGADQTEAAARIFGDGTTGQQGSNYAFNLFTQGTNYVTSQVAVEAGVRTSQDAVVAGNALSADQAEAVARVFGDGTTLSSARAYADAVSGTNSAGLTVINTPLTFYVRTDGTDTNNGLANTPSGAFLTIQGAVNAVCAKVLNATVTVQVNNGTYAESINFSHWIGNGAMIILGNQTNPDTVVINGTNGSGYCFNALVPSRSYVRYLKCHGLNGSFNAARGGVMVVTGITSDGCAAAHFLAYNNGVIEILGICKLTGGAVQALQSGQSKGLIIADSAVFYTSLPQSYGNAFAVSGDLSVIHAASVAFSAGSNVTGVRHSINGLSVIDTQGGGTNTFPGTSPGVTGTGGIFI